MTVGGWGQIGMDKLSCGACEGLFPSHGFSKSQRKKKEKRKCLQCVVALEMKPAENTENEHSVLKTQPENIENRVIANDRLNNNKSEENTDSKEKEVMDDSNISDTKAFKRNEIKMLKERISNRLKTVLALKYPGKAPDYISGRVSGIFENYKSRTRKLGKLVEVKYGWGDEEDTEDMQATETKPDPELTRKRSSSVSSVMDFIRKRACSISSELSASHDRKRACSISSELSASQNDGKVSTTSKANKKSMPEVIGKKRKREISCDKCDGKHETDTCPHFKKQRDNHPDAQRRKFMNDLGGGGGNKFIRVSDARVIHQPGDGSCLFHSLRRGIGQQKGISNTRSLRYVLADWVTKNKDVKIADTKVKEWVKWDSNSSVDTYTKRMRNSAWGGGVEMAACSRHFNVSIHVYERQSGGYKRISCFDSPKPKSVVNVLYCGGIHYDALELNNNISARSDFRSSSYDGSSCHKQKKNHHSTNFRNPRGSSTRFKRY